MRVIIGADPDLTTPSFAVYDLDAKEIVAVHCVYVKSEKDEKHASKVKKTVAALQGCFHYLLESLDFPDLVGIVVEGQELSYTSRSGANPRDILALGWVAGAMLAEARHETKNIMFPAPVLWKGSVPKQIHQTRILSRLGWEYETVGSDPKRGYARPTKPPVKFGGNKADWKHIVDACGLAMYGAVQMQKKEN